MKDKTFFGGLYNLPFKRNYKLKRESSWDRSGGNRDYRVIKPGNTLTITGINGPGVIRHIWFTGDCSDVYWLRKVLLKMYWDNEKSPSVETPFGDFFGAGHGIPVHFISLPLSVIGSGRFAAFNSYFPMPFNNSARIEVTNEADRDLVLYYHIDYEVHEEELGDDVLRFHAKWRRELTKGKEEEKNLTGKDNYLVLSAKGTGHYVGMLLSVRSLKSGWFGEGDDMIFIDDDVWPPSIHGTGTEDYFLSSYGFRFTYSAPYFGIIRVGDTSDWTGRFVVYRFHIEDPIPFKKHIKVTIEHGHANNRSDDWSSVAYWYQTEPHIEFFEMPPPSERVPTP